MSNRSTQQSPTSGTSAISQINQLKPIPGIDDASEDITQRHVSLGRNSGGRGGEQSTRQPVSTSVMKEVDPKSTRQKAVSPPVTASKDINQSQMRSVMGNSTMGSVIRPLEERKPAEEPSDNSTVFVKTKAVSRPAIVREPNNWAKRQTVDMTRALPLGYQPCDNDAKKLVRSHTGVPSRINSNTAVSAAPASSPTPLQPLPDSSGAPSKENAKNKSNEPSEPEVRRKSSTTTSREKKNLPRAQRSTTPTTPSPIYASRSAPSSPNNPVPGAATSSTTVTGTTTTTATSTSISLSQSKGKESSFLKFAKNFLPSSSQSKSNDNNAPAAAAPTSNGIQKSKSATSIYERRTKSKPKEKK